MPQNNTQLPDGFHTRALNDGNVEFRFVNGGKQIVAGSMTPEQLTVVVTNFLNSAHNAFHNADKQLVAGKSKFKGEGIPVMRWYVGGTNQQNQQALIIEVGDSPIAFVVPNEKIRDLARYLIVASCNNQPVPLPFGLLRETARDLAVGLRGFGAVFKARLKASSRRRAISFWSIVSGRSLFIFRTIKISPGVSVPKYDPVGKCIYCGATVYSTKPGLEDRKLGGEHIIPAGIAGSLELPESSCQKCEETTGAKVEGSVLGRTMKALRVHLNLKKAGSGPHPKSLSLDATVNGINKVIPDFPIEDYPIVFNMLIYGPPKIDGLGGSSRTIFGTSFATLKWDQKKLYREYNITGFSTGFWDNHMLCRMLAKIGHSFAVAELKSGKFQPLLCDMICEGKENSMGLIGGDPEMARYPKSDSLHEISLGYQRFGSATYVVAKVRLFAKYSGPIYFVIVGKSLESFIARFTRVLASKISLTPAR